MFTEQKFYQKHRENWRYNSPMRAGGEVGEDFPGENFRLKGICNGDLREL
jgi:hypothetical protein